MRRPSRSHGKILGLLRSDPIGRSWSTPAKKTTKVFGKAGSRFRSSNSIHRFWRAFEKGPNPSRCQRSFRWNLHSGKVDLSGIWEKRYAPHVAKDTAAAIMTGI